MVSDLEQLGVKIETEALGRVQDLMQGCRLNLREGTRYGRCRHAGNKLVYDSEQRPHATEATGSTGQRRAHKTRHRGALEADRQRRSSVS
jgi:hypothetical protein